MNHSISLTSFQTPPGSPSPPESKATPITDSPAGRDEHRGSFHGRPVVVGVTSLLHQVSNRRAIMASGTCSSLCLGLGMYALGSAVHAPDPNDPQAYAPHLVNMLWGAGGLVAGAGFGLLTAKAFDYLLSRFEREELSAPGRRNTARYQLDALVAHARQDSPLTLAGLRTCVARIHELCRLRGDELSAQDAALALARLAAVVPTERTGCPPCSEEPFEHFEALVAPIIKLHADGELPAESFRQALLSLAEHLHAPGDAQGATATAMANRLLEAYSAAARPDGKYSGDARLWACADFMVRLSGTRYFQPHAQEVRVKASQVLGCNPQAYREALPVLTVRSKSDTKAETPIQQVTTLVSRARPERLKAKVASAIGIALHRKRTPVEQARYLLAIVHALASRTDLPPGVFLEGLLAPEAVLALAQAIVKDETPIAPGVDKALLIAELPRLCQLQATGTLMAGITQALRQLPQHASGAGDSPNRAARRARLDESVEAAFTAVDARLTGIRQDSSVRAGSNAWFRLLSSPAASLHHPWLAGAGRQALQAIEPPATEPEDPSQVVIEVKDFLNTPDADES